MDMCNSNMPMEDQVEFGTFLRLDNIGKSEQDKREYRGLHLENGLRVLLISDPLTEISAAAMAVQVGQMFDPDYLPGLAHFCEHMLFLGTEKYPNENDYSAFLSKNSGSTNAYTFALMTKYYFNVASEKLDDGLDRFAQFFIRPLFTSSATEREISAVNSEHEKNLVSDLWRIEQVHRHVAKKGHPYRNFGTGNKATLSDLPKLQNIDVREELLKFHKRWYSANIMTLAVIGSDSLDKLENRVIDRFSQILNKNVKLPKWEREPYDVDQYGQKLLIVPIRDIQSLHLTFTTDDLTYLYKSCPEGYITHLIGHEGEGSILSELRKRGWSNSLMAGHQNINRGFGFFNINISLTKEGAEHVDDVIFIVFQYLRMLRHEEPKKWIFDEFTKVNSMCFRFEDKEVSEMLVKNVVSSMLFYPLEEVLTAPYLCDVWDPDYISKLVNDLVPTKCRITIIGQQYADRTPLNEPYYGTQYGIVPIDKETLMKWENCELNENLALPKANDFIPTNFDIAPIDADVSTHPAIIMDTAMFRVWHKQDEIFLKPKTFMNFDLTSPLAYSDPLNCNLNNLVVSILSDQLNEYMYDAHLAALSVHAFNRTSGISFSITGYSDKQITLLKKLVDHLFDFKMNRERFDVLKEDAIRTLSNFKAEQPFDHAIYYLSLLLHECSWANNELLDAMQLVTYERTLHYAEEFFQRLHIECFIYGNITKGQALDVASIVNARLEATNAMQLPLLARQMLRKREYKLNAGESYLFEQENECHSVNSVEIYFQCGLQSDYLNIMVSLLTLIMTEPCSDCLRTKEQLGYVVFVSPRMVHSTIGVRIIVQSSRHPAFVEERIENFLLAHLATIEAMSEEEFDNFKQSLTIMKLEKAKSSAQQFEIYCQEISSGRYHFERNEAEVAKLANITKDDFVRYFKSVISADGPERRLISVHIVSAKPCKVPADCGRVANHRHKRITDYTAFKASKELYPIVIPPSNIKMKGARSKL